MKWKKIVATISVVVLLVMASVFLSLQNDVEIPTSYDQATIIPTIISGKQFSEEEIELTIEIPVPGVAVKFTRTFVSGTTRCYYPSDLVCYGSSVHCDSNHQNCYRTATWTKTTYTYQQYRKMNYGGTSFSFIEEETGGKWRGTLRIPNFVQQGESSYTLNGNITFSSLEESPRWKYIESKTIKCRTVNHCYGNYDIITSYSGETPPKWQPTSLSITFSKDDIEGEQTVAPSIYDFQLDNTKISFRTSVLALADIDQYAYGEYVPFKKISHEKVMYHEIELPSKSVKYRIKAYNVAHYISGDKEYADFYEFEISIPEEPSLEIVITHESIRENILEVRYKILNETENTTTKFYYRKIGYGTNKPTVYRQGSEYGLELTLENGVYNYWIFAKEGEQEVMTQEREIVISVIEDDKIKMDGDPVETIKATSYKCEFKLTKRSDETYCTYKEKDAPLSELKTIAISRFGYEYTLIINGLNPYTEYEVDIFAGDTLVYATTFKTPYVVTSPTPTSTPPEDGEGFGLAISSLFIIMAIIIGGFYGIYRASQGGKK